MVSWRKIWKQNRVANREIGVEDLIGRWRVEMVGLRGWLFWFFKVWTDHKEIRGRRGWNEWLWDWGRFRTIVIPLLGCFGLDYDIRVSTPHGTKFLRSNPRFVSGILDLVRWDPVMGKWVGKFTYSLAAALGVGHWTHWVWWLLTHHWMLGYFTLTREGDDVPDSDRGNPDDS